MSSGVESLTAGIADPTGKPATAKVSSNLKVSTATGNIGIVGDVITFGNESYVSGSWIMGSTRVTINAMPVISGSASSTSVPTPATSAPGPMQLTTSDQKVSVS